MVRALLEAICFQAVDVLLAMKADADVSALKTLAVDGGASRNNLLMQVGGSYSGGGAVSVYVAGAFPRLWIPTRNRR